MIGWGAGDQAGSWTTVDRIFFSAQRLRKPFFSWSGRIGGATLNAQLFHKLATLGLIEKGKWLRS